MHHDLQEGVSVLTTEKEHINADAVEEACKELNIIMEPTPHTIRLIQVSITVQYFWRYSTHDSIAQYT
jgi:phosphoribosylaminoimidazole carboxylase (NCAIR synthetase)